VSWFLSACHRSAEESNRSSAENNPSWLLPLLPARATGALLALFYLHPDRDKSLLSMRYSSVPSVDALRASMNATRNWRRSSGSGFSISRADSVIPAERSSDTT
jgi:hypothetical protein